MCSIPSVGQGEHHEDLNDHWFCLLCFVFKLGGDFICKQKRREPPERRPKTKPCWLQAGQPVLLSLIAMRRDLEPGPKKYCIPLD